MTDVFNIENEIQKLKSEIKSLKDDSKYLKKKAEITPLVAIYNHVRGKNLNDDHIVTSIKFFTRTEEPKPFLYNKIIALNNEIYDVDESQKVCNIKDIIKIELMSTIDGKDKIYEYNFAN